MSESSGKEPEYVAARASSEFKGRQRLKFSESPFILHNGLPQYEVREDSTLFVEPLTLKVKSSKAIWSDLLLDVAMTTTFTSLTDGTDVMEPLSALSYLAYFAMVWWIWASQVAHNVRFRTSDWSHRIFVFLQLLVFCALAAFTRQFDIASGISKDDDESLIRQFQRFARFTDEEIEIGESRSNLLDRLNGRGISISMGLSRLLLFAQYARVLYYAKGVKRQALWLQCGVILLSSFSFFLANAFIRDEKGFNIVKIILWLLPLVVEAGSHFVADKLPGRTEYPSDAVYDRAATVFIIILGGGLDKITEGFRYIAGNVALGSKGAGLIFCAAIIFITQFTTYFGTRSDPKPSDRRILSWFFMHFFYLSALILTLQGVAALLQFGNIGSSLQIPIRLFNDLSSEYLSNPGEFLNASSFEDLRKPLVRLELALNTIVDDVNFYINATDDTTVVVNDIRQWSISGIAVALNNLDAFPDADTLLYSQMLSFLTNDAENTTVVNSEAYSEIFEGVLSTHDKPSMWFFAVAGLTIVTLMGMGLFVRWPKNQYEWWISSSRLVFGIIVCALALLSVGHKRIEVSGDNPTVVKSTPISTLARNSLVLPILAVLLIVEQSIELLAMFIFSDKPSMFGAFQADSGPSPTTHSIAPLSFEVTQPYGTSEKSDDPTKSEAQLVQLRSSR